MLRLVRETLETSLLALALFLVIQIVFQPFRVEQHSMEPTLHEGQYTAVNKLAYSTARELTDFLSLLPRPASASEPVTSLSPSSKQTGISRGDIVVLHHPRLEGEYLIKRVIGLPGETIEAKNGYISVNGVPLDESYTLSDTAYSMPATTIPLGQVFILGDNRNNSYDSHAFGAVSTSVIVGKAYPLPFSAFSLPSTLRSLGLAE